MEKLIVGIDFGTTNSAVAYLDDDGKPQIIPNREGERVTPSVILFENNSPVIGSMAQMNAISDPLNVIQFVKRQIGNSSYKFVTDDGGDYTPEELSAMVLRRLKEDAEEFLAQPVNQAVITVPAYFDDVQRKAIQDAGIIAGLEVLKVINEPTAAALVYGLNCLDNTQNIMVYDLGGGTFDVTIMTLQDNEIKIRATGGDRNLGGFDFDNKIIEYVRDLFQKEYEIDVFDDIDAMQDLRQKAEYCKKMLSNKDKVAFSMLIQGRSIKVEINRELFESLIAGLLNRTTMIMESVLEDSGLGWSDISKILLVGGSTRIKAVQRLIESLTGHKPSQEVNPDEAVALGAAIQGTLLQDDIMVGKPESNLRVTSISDVNSHSLGVLAIDTDTEQLKNCIILHRNTPIPAKANQIFNTGIDEQEHIIVTITEGEDEDPEYVRIIGEAQVKLLNKGPKGYPIKISISYDDNGIIHAFASDELTSDSLGEIHIERKSNLTQEALLFKATRMSKIKIE